MYEIAPEPFDYDALDAVTREFVVRKADETRGLLRRTAQNVIAIGRNLQAVKEQLPHGQFLPWLQTEFAMTERHARNFMHAAARLGSKPEIIADLSVTVIYELAAPSTPESVIEQVVQEQVPPTVDAIREAKEAERHALSGQEALQRQLAQERADAAAQIEQLAREAGMRAAATGRLLHPAGTTGQRGSCGAGRRVCAAGLLASTER